MKVTIFRNVFAKTEPNLIHVSTALKRIREGNSQSTIALIREGDKELKKKLPVGLFSGSFSERKDDAIQEHSGFVILDFDHIDASSSKKMLGGDPYVYSCWTSPSGDGLKALVRITNPERHRDHFRALKTYFDTQYGLEVDDSGKNESRACFESFDPDLILNEDSDKFGAFATELSESQVAVSKAGVFTDYMKLNLAARMVRQCEDGKKHETLLKAARLIGGYISAGRIEEDEAVRVLMREILKRDIGSEKSAEETILHGINAGKKDPLRVTLADEKNASRELLINDGDMSFISSDDEDFRWIDDFANGNIAVGLDTGSDAMDQNFRYKREFVIMNGHSNVGKTTTALYLMVNSAIRHGWKWAVYSSENRTASLKMTLMGFATNRQVSDMTFEQRRESYRWVN